MLWESDINVGCILMYVLWVLATVLLFVATWLGPVCGRFGLLVAAAAVCLTIMRDNQRTRRMLARKGEVVAPIR